MSRRQVRFRTLPWTVDLWGGDYLPGAFGSGVSLDSGLMAGMSSLEPFEQSVLNTLLVARPGKGITEEISDWEPVAHPVPDTTLDGRLMEGTTYLEHSVIGVSLDSGLMAGMSSLEPLQQSVLNTLLVARPEKVLWRSSQIGSRWRFRFRTLPWTVDLWRGLHTWSIRLWGCLDSGLMVGMSRLEPFEQSVLNTLLVARPGDGITKEIADWEPVAHPVPGTSLDGRPIEGTTNLEHSVLVGSLDSGLMAGMSRPEPLEQSVLSTLLVA